MVFQCVVVKCCRPNSNSTRKKIHNDNFLWGSLDYDIECTILCKVHLGLNIYPSGNFFCV